MPDKRQITISIGSFVIVVLLIILFVIVNSTKSKESDNIDETLIEDIVSEDSKAAPDQENSAKDLPLVKQDIEADNKTSLVKPVISSWNISGKKLNVRGYIPSILEDGGNCIFKLLAENDSEVLSIITRGLMDVSKTTCPSVDFNIASLSKGSYSIILSYSSPGFEGISQSQEITL
jgi:hypothetical protein